MPSWKKVIISGSDAALNSLTVSNGATVSSSLTLSGSINNVNYIDFNTSYTATQPVAGRLSWNNSDGTLDLGMKGGNVTQQIGEEIFYEVRNDTGTSIANGTSVYANGVTVGSSRITAAPFVADGSVREVRYLGLATEDISNGVNGFVTRFGYVRNLDTRGNVASSIAVGDETWAVGDILYAHPTVAGKLTNVKPKHDIIVCIIIVRHQSTGVVFVKPSDYGHLDDLHDVNINTGSLSTGDLLIYNSGSDYWINSKQLSGSYGLTGSLSATSFTGSLFGTASYATQALSASFATSASFAVSSSRAISSSFAISASYAPSTPAFPFTGSARITGSLNVLGPVSITGSFTQGNQGNISSGLYSHAEGSETIALGNYSHAEGLGKVIEWNYETLSTNGNSTFGPILAVPYSISLNQIVFNGNITSSIPSFPYTINTLELSNTSENEYYVIVDFGYSPNNPKPVISGASYNAGSNTTTFTLSTPFLSTYPQLLRYGHASGSYSHAEGDSTKANGDFSHAEGSETIASGDYSHAEGAGTIAIGTAAHAAGLYTLASGDYQSVIGQYNLTSSAQSAFIIGNGTSNASRSNLVFASGSRVQVTGSVIATQGFTGSLFGTASYATQALSASFATTASFVSGQFFNTFSQSAAAATWSFAHNLSNKNPIITVWNNADEVIIPEKIVGTNTNLATIFFPFPVSGYASATVGSIIPTASGSIGSTVITGSLRGQVSALSIASNTASLDLATNNFFTLTLANGANTHISASNIQPGQTVNIRVTQGSAGTGTLSFNSAIKQASGSLYTGSMIANSVDMVSLISFDQTNAYISYINNFI